MFKGRNAILAAVAGALCLAASGPITRLARTSAGTAAFYRCALVVLAPLAVMETRRRGPRSRRERIGALAAGALLGADLILWNRSIDEAGAGIATVLVNIQVLLVPVLALLIDREPMSRRFL
ncbi:EamA family transporter [Actinomadura rubrisoli]|nr:EamA family transporter [Actinomadura rubrisoli]